MKEKLKEYLFKLRMELAMKHTLNGWYVEWLKNKIKEIQNKIK